jgi:hypothetical protein
MPSVLDIRIQRAFASVQIFTGKQTGAQYFLVSRILVATVPPMRRMFDSDTGVLGHFSYRVLP